MKNRSSKFKVITANQIVIEDADGCPRILLDGVDGGVGASITLLSKSHNEIRISVENSGHSSISIRHPNGKTAASIAVMKDKKSGIELRDADGLPSIMMESGLKKQKARIQVVRSRVKKRSENG